MGWTWSLCINPSLLKKKALEVLFGTETPNWINPRGGKAERHV